MERKMFARFSYGLFLIVRVLPYFFFNRISKSTVLLLKPAHDNILY
ncbi:unnamed protein product [Amoebophrya sp. A120]|nr:unnamed protein product [Amoebophrya sp. A120]|eukprot:GSA120T00008351001.1